MDSQGEAGKTVRRSGPAALAKTWSSWMSRASKRDATFARQLERERIEVRRAELVVMGPQWLDAKARKRSPPPGRPRGFPVPHRNRASALRRDIPVIPVLVHGADDASAPTNCRKNLTDLAYRNCIELTHCPVWKSDTQLLIEGHCGVCLQTRLESRKGPNPLQQRSRPHPSMRNRERLRPSGPCQRLAN